MGLKINLIKELTKSQRRINKKRNAKKQKIELRESRKRKNLKKNMINKLFKRSRYERDMIRIYGEKAL